MHSDVLIQNKAEREKNMEGIVSNGSDFMEIEGTVLNPLFIFSSFSDTRNE